MLILITIITVVFNGAKDIEKTILSVIKQKRVRPNLTIEYIVIDGCSNDGLIDIIGKYDSHITKWISEPDRGIYDAMNKGLSLAQESYILFLGAGDEIISLPDESLFIDKNIAIFGDVIMANKLFKSNISKGLKMGNSLHHQALLIHKSVIPTSGFNLNYKVYADYDLNIRLFNEGVKFIRSNKMLSKQLQGGLSSKTHALELVDVIKNNFGLYWASRMLIYCLAVQLKQILLMENITVRWN
ncbi:putative glycosyl transferase [Calothrix sp. NIES-4071]|nr:putative glycosyl transferase [Calothrix sp. NIES-4071]BAZ57047.1 putative glycosyl transferase [Calothrix sp. NIES-4105]